MLHICRALAALLAALTLSACGASVSNGFAHSENVENSSAADSSHTIPADPAEDSLSVGDSYRLYRQVTVSDGRILTLVAHGEKTNAYSFGISTIEVKDSDTLLQTISIHDGIAAGNLHEGWVDSRAGDCTQSFEAASGLDLRDYNFDGFPDLAITEFWGTANERKLLWLWDDTAGIYTFSLPLVGTEIQPDANTRTVTTRAKNGAADVVITTYAPASDGQIQKIRETVETYRSDADTETVTHALVDGKWVAVENNE